MKFHKFIYHKITRPLRLKRVINRVNKLQGKTLLEIGYFDDSMKRLLRKDFEYFGIDPNPTKRIESMPVVSIENFETDKKFDIVTAFEILEHTKDPVKAIKKIKILSNKYICISVPYEPFYTISRLFVPEKEHYWTIHPNILKYYFGKPIYEKKILLWRHYFAIYTIENVKKTNLS